MLVPQNPFLPLNLDLVSSCRQRTDIGQYSQHSLKHECKHELPNIKSRALVGLKQELELLYFI